MYSDTKIITIMLIAIIIFIILIAVSVYFLFFYKKTQLEINQNINESLNKKNSKKKVVKPLAGDALLNFNHIFNNIIILNQKASIVIECEGIKLELMSEKEKNILFYKYTSLFKNLSDPIQIFIKSDSIKYENKEIFKQNSDALDKDIKKDIYKYKHITKNSNTNSETIENLKYDIQRKELLLKYISDFSNYTNTNLETTKIMSKSYYIIISIDENERYKRNLIDNNLVQKYLVEKAKNIQKKLDNCNIRNNILTQYELCNLLYLIYNPNNERLINFNDLLSAGFFKESIKTN